eukprot:scaffold24708_cov101-Isochrysis_galbana.AAC.7
MAASRPDPSSGSRHRTHNPQVSSRLSSRPCLCWFLKRVPHTLDRSSLFQQAMLWGSDKLRDEPDSATAPGCLACLCESYFSPAFPHSCRSAFDDVYRIIACGMR